MHQPFEMGKDRHARLGLDAGHQGLAATGHDDVHIAIEPLEHFAHGGPVGGGHQLYAFDRQAGQMQPVEQAINDGAGGMETVAAAAQDDGIARFDAERAGIGRHIGPAFEDDADDAQRRAHALDMEPIGPVPFGNHRADGIGQLGNGLHRFDNAVDARIGQQQAIEKGLGNALLFGCLHVERIGGEDLFPMRIDGAGRRQQRGALLFGRGDLERIGALAGIAADLGHQARNIGRGGFSQAHGWPLVFAVYRRCRSAPDCRDAPARRDCPCPAARQWCRCACP
ncbi:hypothetical protein D3C87_1278830 [compost metagenome]